MIEIILALERLKESSIKQFGEKEGENTFNYLLNITQLKLKTQTIIYELDNLIDLYTNQIFIITEEFYSKKYKSNYDDDTKKILKVVNEINGNPTHEISDEVNLLFYVGLYHKIENYENEILEFYNILNDTKFKTLKSIGIDIPNKRKLFADRDRIRLICNSIKHNNYYPKQELLKFYPYFSLEQKISLKDLNPKEDLNLVKNYIQHFNFLVIFKNLLTVTNHLRKYDIEFPNELEEYFEIFSKDESLKDEKLMFTYLKK